MQFTTTVINQKTGIPGSFHKIWVDGDKARIEEYTSQGKPISTVLLTDGQTGYMYTPRTQNATVFSGISTLTAQAANFVTEANMKAAWGGVVQPQPDEPLNGVNCRVYKLGGLMAWFDASTGLGIRYASVREATTPGGTFYSDIKIPADHDNSLYTLPPDAHIKNPGFVPGIGGK
jgi:hypothetical protein